VEPYNSNLTFLCSPVQLGLAVAVSGGGAFVRGGLASARGRTLRRSRV
jgi:hypothetical protein